MSGTKVLRVGHAMALALLFALALGSDAVSLRYKPAPMVPPNSKCVEIKGFEAMGCVSDSYFGTIADGFSVKTVKEASDKVMMLLGMVESMGLVPEKYQSQFKKCLPKFKADICETVMPRCSDKCQPLKTCQSACKELKSECIPSEIQAQFGLVMPGAASLLSLWRREKACACRATTQTQCATPRR